MFASPYLKLIFTSENGIFAGNRDANGKDLAFQAKCLEKSCFFALDSGFFRRFARTAGRAGELPCI
jgi:hypothetical protein